MTKKIDPDDAILLACAMPSTHDADGYLVAERAPEREAVDAAALRLDGLVTILRVGRYFFAKRTAAGDAALTDDIRSKSLAARKAISTGVQAYEMGRPCPDRRLSKAGWLFAQEAKLGEAIEIGWGAGGDLRGLELLGA